MPEHHQPVLISSKLIRSGKEDEARVWREELGLLVSSSPGHHGLVQLEQPGGLFHFVHRFASMAEMDSWRRSARYRELERSAEGFSIERSQSASGRTLEFSLPSEAATPKWKTWLATWVPVYPLLLALNLLIDTLLPDLSKPLSLAIMSLTMTAVLTWVILPKVKGLLRPWLLGGDAGELRKTAD